MVCLEIVMDSFVLLKVGHRHYYQTTTTSPTATPAYTLSNPIKVYSGVIKLIAFMIESSKKKKEEEHRRTQVLLLQSTPSG